MKFTKLASAVALLGTLGFSANSALAAELRQTYIFNLKGTATATPCQIPATDQGTTSATCFNLDLFDPQTGRLIGRATDALSDIQELGNGSLALVGTTSFELPQGTLVIRGKTTVQPTTIGSPLMTHITGAIPSPGENNILPISTGAFQGAQGSVRLSGAVNMSKLATEGKITFDCIFVVTPVE